MLGLDMPTFWAPLTFGNTGNLGLPLALFAFGQAGFDFAVVIFAVMAIISFTFGVWVVAGGGNPVAAIREPLVWGTVLGVVFLVLGWTVPAWAGATLDLVGQMAIPLMLHHPRRRDHPAAAAGARAAPSGSAWSKLALCTAVPLGDRARPSGCRRRRSAVLVLQIGDAGGGHLLHAGGEVPDAGPTRSRASSSSRR